VQKRNKQIEACFKGSFKPFQDDLDMDTEKQMQSDESGRGDLCLTMAQVVRFVFVGCERETLMVLIMLSEYRGYVSTRVNTQTLMAKNGAS
jgi:hypothetical protein